MDLLGCLFVCLLILLLVCFYLKEHTSNQSPTKVSNINKCHSKPGYKNPLHRKKADVHRNYKNRQYFGRTKFLTDFQKGKS